jgi:hypothetical protein
VCEHQHKNGKCDKLRRGATDFKVFLWLAVVRRELREPLLALLAERDQKPSRETHRDVSNRFADDQNPLVNEPLALTTYLQINILDKLDSIRV